MLYLEQKIRSFINLAVFGWLAGLFLALFCVSSASAQDGDLFPVPGTYQIEGIPPIKNSEVANLFYDPSTIKDNLIWDTDSRNRRILVTDQTNSVYLLNTPLSQPVKLLDKIVPNTLRTRPNGEAFAYTDDHEHEDNYQLYYYDFNIGSPKKLTTLTGKDESVESFVWSQSGDSLLYSKVDYDTKTSKICQNDLTAEKCFQVDLKGIWNVLDGNRDKILLKYWKASSAQHLYIYDVQTSKLTPIDEKGNSRKGFLIGERVFWTSEGNDICGKIPCILSLNLISGEVKKLELPKNILDIDDVKFSPSGSYILVQDSNDGIDNLHILRLRKDRIVKEIPPFISGPFVIWNIRWLSDTEIVYTLENIGKPASIHSYNIESKQTADWTEERLPTQLENKIKPPEIIKWRSFDQKEITGYVVRPKLTAKRSPVLIYVHGGPQILDKPTFNSLDIRFASNLGITTIHTNIRGSSGFGDEFMDSDNKDKRGDAVKDIQALLDWITKQPDLDSDQIYLRGQSYGGFIVLSTAMQEPRRIKGVVAEYPVVSIRGMLSESWIDEFAKNEYGDPNNDDLMGKLDQLSPLNNSERWNKIPLFLTRGKLDSRNPEKDVTNLKTQLQRRGSEVWYVYSTSDGHGFSSKYVIAAMFEFLKKQISNKKENLNEKN